MGYTSFWMALFAILLVHRLTNMKTLKLLYAQRAKMDVLLVKVRLVTAPAVNWVMILTTISYSQIPCPV